MQLFHHKISNIERMCAVYTNGGFDTMLRPLALDWDDTASKRLWVLCETVMFMFTFFVEVM